MPSKPYGIGARRDHKSENRRTWFWLVVVFGGCFLYVCFLKAEPVEGHVNVNEAVWWPLKLAPEKRCAPYDRADYPYPQSVERDIINEMGDRTYGPYTGRYFEDRSQVDVDHIVALSEAHDSGLCAADAYTKAAFARDTHNLTLAAPEINRCNAGGKCGKDVAEWLPQKNVCWFAHRVLSVRTKYDLTIDQKESEALEDLLINCQSSEMVFHE